MTKNLSGSMTKQSTQDNNLNLKSLEELQTCGNCFKPLRRVNPGQRVLWHKECRTEGRRNLFRTQKRIRKLGLSEKISENFEPKNPSSVPELKINQTKPAINNQTEMLNVIPTANTRHRTQDR